MYELLLKVSALRNVYTVKPILLKELYKIAGKLLQSFCFLFLMYSVAISFDYFFVVFHFCKFRFSSLSLDHDFFLPFFYFTSFFFSLKFLSFCSNFSPQFFYFLRFSFHFVFIFVHVLIFFPFKIFICNKRFLHSTWRWWRPFTFLEVSTIDFASISFCFSIS